MKKSQYWTVKQTHAKAAYNDENEYAIVNGEGAIIARFYAGRRDELTQIVDAHNQCFFDAMPVVRGRWKAWEEQFPGRTTRKKNNLGVFCSACQLHADNMTSYCPNCGAKMEDDK